jgi:hypothetical protein
MTDRTERSNRRLDKRKTSKARIPLRNDLFDALWTEMLGRVEEMINERALTMGTVTGSGDNVKVRLDDEDEDRTIGFSKSMGVAYDKGDKVPIARTSSGVPIVLPPVNQGKDKRVRNEQLDDEAVDKRAIKKGEVDSSHLDKNLDKTIKDAVQKNDLDKELKGYATISDLKGVQADASAALKNAATALSTASGLESRIKKLEARVSKLEKKLEKK